MFRRAEVEVAVRGRGESPGGDPAHSEVAPPLAFRRPERSGNLDELLDHRPLFRRHGHGYDRAQVDNYVAWAEGELDAARRQCDYLLTRYGDCAAALAMVRRSPAPSSAGSSATGPVSARLGEMLRLASEEADAVMDAGVAEAERIVTEARRDADARLAKVARIRQAAVAAGEMQRAQARRDAERLLREAAAQRDAAAAQAAAELAAVRTEVADLRRQRDEARESLHRLTAQINQALQAAAGGTPEERAVVAERRDHPAPSLA